MATELEIYSSNAIDTKVDELKTRISDLSSSVNRSVAELDAKDSELQSNIESLSSSVDANIQALKKKDNEINESVTALSSSVDQKFESVNRAMSQVFEEVGVTKDDVDAAKADITTLQGNVATINGDGEVHEKQNKLPTFKYDDRIFDIMVMKSVDAQSAETAQHTMVADKYSIATGSVLLRNKFTEVDESLQEDKSNIIALSGCVANLERKTDTTNSELNFLKSNTYDKEHTYNKEEVNALLGSVFHYKGSVGSASDLPSQGQITGDVWNVTDTGDNYAWSGSEWDKLSGEVDLSQYSTTAQVTNLIDTKINTALPVMEDMETTTYDVSVKDSLSAVVAKKDAKHNVIDETYATKTELSSYATKEELNGKEDTLPRHSVDKGVFDITVKHSRESDAAIASDYSLGARDYISDIMGDNYGSIKGKFDSVDSEISNCVKSNTVEVKIGSYAVASSRQGISIGYIAKASGTNSIAIGSAGQGSIGYPEAKSSESIAIGHGAVVCPRSAGDEDPECAVQIGEGTNNDKDSLQFRSTKIVGSDGKIPSESLSDDVVTEDNQAEALAEYDSEIKKNMQFGKDNECGFACISIGNKSKASGDGGYNIAIGCNAEAKGYSDNLAIGSFAKTTEGSHCAIAIGDSSKAMNEESVAIGREAVASGYNSVQLGSGMNSTANTLQFRNTVIVDETGHIPEDALSDNVIRKGSNTIEAGESFSVSSSNTGISISSAEDAVNFKFGGSDNSVKVSGTSGNNRGLYLEYDTGASNTSKVKFPVSTDTDVCDVLATEKFVNDIVPNEDNQEILDEMNVDKALAVNVSGVAKSAVFDSDGNNIASDIDFLYQMLDVAEQTTLENIFPTQPSFGTPVYALNSSKVQKILFGNETRVAIMLPEFVEDNVSTFELLLKTSETVFPSITYKDHKNNIVEIIWIGDEPDYSNNKTKLLTFRFIDQEWIASVQGEW